MKNVRMRHLFQAAVQVEEQGIAFYQKLANRTADDKVRKLCLTLADDEEKHRQLFQEALARWTALPPDPQILDALLNELKSTGLFLEPDHAELSERKLLEYAVNQEKKTAVFYAAFEHSFPDFWKRMHIQHLVLTENKHATELAALLSTTGK